MTILGAAALTLACGAAGASIVSGDVTGGRAANREGQFVKLEGASIKAGKNGFDTWNLYGFDERQDFTLTSDLVTSTGVIAAGTKVSSHYVMFDPKHKGRQIGSVTFDAIILGVISSVKTLMASDYLGLDGIKYYTGKGRGLEGTDSAVVSRSDANTLLVNWKANSPGDYIRVITAAIDTVPVPVPAAGLLLLGALGGLSAVRRRKA